MRKLFIKFIIIGLSLCFVSPSLQANESFDFSALDILWGIIDILKDDRDPSMAQWDSLVGTPGYAALLTYEGQYGLSYLQKNLNLVFKPSLKAKLEENKGDRAIKHFLDFKDKLPDVRKFQGWLSNPTVEKDAMDILENWLPQGVLKEGDSAPVSFILFTKDARGGYGRLIFDILYALEKGDDFLSLFAHEAFHYFRGKTMIYDEGNIKVPHVYILRSINMQQNEGTADHIDKFNIMEQALAEAPSPYISNYRKEYQETPKIIRIFDQNLSRLNDTNPDYNSIGREMVSAVPMSGHPTGFFMAKAIHDVLGKETLLSIYNNPFAFIYSYNIAAHKSGDLPTLSNSAIKGLHKLENYYLDKPDSKMARAAMITGIDTQAIQALGKIKVVLESDEEPDTELWNQLFNNPGYQCLFTYEPYFNPESLKNTLSLIYKPSRKEELQKNEGSYSLGHFLKHKQDFEKVKRTVSEFKQSGQFESICNHVYTSLGISADELLNPPQVSFIYFGNDLRFGYPVFVADPMRVVLAPDHFNYYLLSYLIFSISNEYTKYNRADLTLRMDVYIDGIEQIQRKGIIDLLAQMDTTLVTTTYTEKYATQLADIDKVFDELDKHFAAAQTNSTIWSDFGQITNSLFTRPGCPLGYYMTKTITEKAGFEALQRTLGDPIQFLLNYQEIAEKSPTNPQFSEKSVQMLRELKSTM